MLHDIEKDASLTFSNREHHVRLKEMNIPTKSDWAHHPDDLDAAWAERNFLGKTREQAVAMFEENSLNHQEDIMFMPIPCFAFYTHAYIDYLMSDKSEADRKPLAVVW